MNFIDKTLILKDLDENSVCMFVDKISFMKEGFYCGDTILTVNMIDGASHRFREETICGFLRKINMGCEHCDSKD